eukprot:jgi/Tetstr1/432883/TSEL_022232.t1
MPLHSTELTLEDWAQEPAEEDQASTPAMFLVQRKDGTREIVMAALQAPPSMPRPWASADPTTPSPTTGGDKQRTPKKKKFHDASEGEMAEVALASHERREQQWRSYYTLRNSHNFRHLSKALIVLNVLIACMDLLWDSIQPVEERMGRGISAVFLYTYVELLLLGVVDPIVFRMSLPPAVRSAMQFWSMLIIEGTVSALSVAFGPFIMVHLLPYTLGLALPFDGVPLDVLRPVLAAWFRLRLVHDMIIVNNNVNKKEFLRARNNFVVSEKELHSALESVPNVGAELYYYVEKLHSYAIHGDDAGQPCLQTTSAQHIAAALSEVAGGKSRKSWAATVYEILNDSEEKSYGVAGTVLSCAYWLAKTPILSFLMLGLTVAAGFLDVFLSEQIGAVTAEYVELAGSCQTRASNSTATGNFACAVASTSNGISSGSFYCILDGGFLGTVDSVLSGAFNGTSTGALNGAQLGISVPLIPFTGQALCRTQWDYIWPALKIALIILGGTVSRNLAIMAAGIVTSKLEGTLSGIILRRVCAGDVDSLSEGDIGSRFSRDVTKVLKLPRQIIPKRAAVKGSQKGSVKAAILNGTFINAVRLRRVMGLYDAGDMVMQNAEPVVEGAIEGSMSNELTLTTVQFANKLVSTLLTVIGVVAVAAKECAEVASDENSIAELAGNVTATILLVKGLDDTMRKMADGIVEMLNLCLPLQRLDQVARHARKQKDGDREKDGTRLAPLSRAVEYKDVKFTYPGSKTLVLKGMSAAVRVGEYTCVVGGSGAGKSTLMSLITREQVENSGFVGFDGVPLASVTAKEVRKQLGVVMQDTAILNGTVAANIRMGRPDATGEEVRKAVDLAEVTPFVSQLPGGFETIIGPEADSHMSDGQLQRICLARALIRNPRFLLLDEATSALDARTEATIINTVVRLVRGTGLTCMSITHKMPTTVQADKVLGLKQGKVAEFGPPAELLRNKDGVHAKLMNTAAASSSRADAGKKDRSPALDDALASHMACEV